MSYSVSILADSISPDGIRLTTMEATFPRFLLAEFNTHRVFSRNSASSRAIPSEKIIQRVIEDPFIPTFNKRVKGMGVGEALADDDARLAQDIWMDAAYYATERARALIKLDCDKSRINRLLEPFMWHTVIVTATEWSNFYALRTDEAAQPEFRKVALMMQEAQRENKPKYIDYNEWHLPLLDDGDRALLGIEAQRLVSAGKCARSSYDLHHDPEPRAASMDRANRLMSSGHMSPLEHQATPQKTWPESRIRWFGNFRGWVQFRKRVFNESDFSKVVRV